jgi:GDP-L-fucose synthase
MVGVLGATGFLGTRVCQELKEQGIEYIPSPPHKDFDIRDTEDLYGFFDKQGITKIINCAAYSGGLKFAMSHPVSILENNIDMILNIYATAVNSKVERIVNPISNCVYPAKATLFKEDELWDGALHESVYMYGFTRRVELAMAWAYKKEYNFDSVNIVCSNMYGEGDHFDLLKSHALGALIMKFVDAEQNNTPEVVVWGTGKPVREWLYVGDAAKALIRGLDILPYDDIINVGTGTGISMKDLALMIADFAGYKGKIVFDDSYPDGAPYKTVDGTRGKQILGFAPSMPMEQGIKQTIKWYKENQ